MKRFIPAFLILLFASCSGPAPVVEKTYPFKLIRSASKEGATIEAYVCTAPINEDTLAAFCLKKKAEQTEGMYFLYVFDDEKNATVDSPYPITAMFGGEEKPLINIKAVYNFMYRNGFSELSFYDTNMYEGKAKRTKL